MKGFTIGMKCLTAAALLVAMPAVSVFAAKTTPATDKNTNVSAVPRNIPDLIPYHKFDPPKSKAFDLSKLTISGDLRVRPEFRTNGRFGRNATNTATGIKNNDSFVQQWIRLGFNYDISPDVSFFIQPQYAKIWGKAGAVGSGTDANATAGESLFVRQGFVLIRNLIVPNLTMKAGRQLIVWGNHRLFGHFDWNNVGWAHDAVSLRYSGIKNWPLEFSWISAAQGDCGATSGGGCGPNATAATSEANIVFLRAPGNIMGIKVEPVWIWESGGTGGSVITARPSNQTRHTVGARVAGKMKMVDFTGEGYYQFGDIGSSAGSVDRNLDIDAYALHFDAGVTLPVPMQPRIGGEFNMASGDGDANVCAGDATNVSCNGNHNTFSQLFPTNHIHFGYMDRMSWKNMVHYAGSLQLRPTKNSHFEVLGHIFKLQTETDNWYSAGQGVFMTSAAGNTEDDLGSEIDVVYTLFFHENKVGWQTGYGHFFPGDYVETTATGDAPGEDWGYTSLWINF